MAVRLWDGDRHADRLVGASYRLSDGDRHADGLVGLSYRWSGGDRWSDGWVYMVDERSDDVGQHDRRGKMVCRWSDGDGLSDRWITGLTVGVTD